MKSLPHFTPFKLFIILFLLFSTSSYSQLFKINYLNGPEFVHGTTLDLSSTSSQTFRITNNIGSSCANLTINSITILSTADFNLTSTEDLTNPYGIKRGNSNCNGPKYLDFTITANNLNCGVIPLTRIDILYNAGGASDSTFSFYIGGTREPIITVSGGSPLTTITNGSTTPSSTTGTTFGTIEVVGTENSIRNYTITNTGNCVLDLGNLTINGYNPVTGIASTEFSETSSLSNTSIAIGGSATLSIKFDPTATGTHYAIVSIANNDTDKNPYTFVIKGDGFDSTTNGPGGFFGDFRLWLKTTRGVTRDGSDKVSLWRDYGSNGKHATQSDSNKQPTYIDDATNNINYNPVIQFQNGALNQYLENSDNGYYDQEIFIIMEPDVDVSTSSRMTIFSGTIDGITPYIDDSNDETAVGLGDFTSRISGERLWFNQGSSSTNPYYSLTASTSRSYDKAAIINVKNKTATPSDGMCIVFNTVDDAVTPTNNTAFSNLGYVDTIPDPDLIYGTPYKIGKNDNDATGSLNGRVAEIFTYATRLTDNFRHRVESYLAIKYGITLGETVAAKNYIDSNDSVIWDITANASFNNDVTGIGRDDASDLYQKQSKSINDSNAVTIGLGTIASTNLNNINEFSYDRDFLVWGNDNGAITTTGVEKSVTIKNATTTKFTRINCKWKIVESKFDSSGDVGNVFIAIPSNAFSGFSKTATEEYVLIVSDTEDFNDGDIIDVIPLKSDGASSLQTWYDFDDIKYFSFGKAPKFEDKNHVDIASGDFLVGEYELDLSSGNFTVSCWIKNDGTSATSRTIMAKGSVLQLILNASHKIEGIWDGSSRFISNTTIADGKWHYISTVYSGNTVLLYIDGVLDQPFYSVNSPTNFSYRFSIGALYNNKNSITNPFLGSIEELQVWDTALTEEQIHYLMNQEIEKFLGDSSVNGIEIPQPTTLNEVKIIPWNDLKAYYNFNCFYGSTVEGMTNDRYFLRINYLSKNKEINISQTAPLPYKTEVGGNWDTPATWLNNDVQPLPNSLSIVDGTTRVDWNIVETDHNVNATRNTKVLGLKVNSNELSINSDNSLEISHYLKLNGVIDLDGESQLIQTLDSDFDDTSTGYLERDQQGEGNLFRYNDWSSPVIKTNTSSTTPFTIADVLKDGTDPSTPSPIVFNDGSYDGKTSPMTLSTYWMFKYVDSPYGDYSSWLQIRSTGDLSPGEGFLMKGTGSPSDQNYVFVGKPNNGEITLSVAPDYGYLVGNPYPSSLDADQFILDNANSITGTLYFWEHYGGDSHYIAEYQAGYATYNMSGGIAPASPHPMVDQTAPSSPKTPEAFIAVAQGFFVQGDADGGDIVFNNSQRIYKRESLGESIFMKGSKSKTASNENISIQDQRLKIRLGFDAANIDHRQLLLTIDERATDNVDYGFDGEIYEQFSDDMFWIIENKKYVIQGTNEINLEKEIPIGIQTLEGGNISIMIDNLENFEENSELFIKDLQTGETYNITDNSFDIYLEAGEYFDRFVLAFQARLKTIEEIELIEGITIAMNNSTSELQLKKIIDVNIETINIYNYLGQKIKEWNSNLVGRTISLPVSTSSGAYIVNVKTSEGNISKKIIKK